MQLRIAIVFILFSSSVFSQSLSFINASKNKVVDVKIGQTLVVQYTGYLGQTYLDKNIVSEINDTMITLGYSPNSIPKFLIKAQEKNGQLHRCILIKDILAFRKITLERQLLKSTLTASAVVLSYLFFSEIMSSKNTSNLENFGISLSVGILSGLIINGLFPENTKHKMSEGWVVVVK